MDEVLNKYFDLTIRLLDRCWSNKKRKCGVVRLSERRLWKDLCTNKQYPTLVQYEGRTQNVPTTHTNTSNERYVYPCAYRKLPHFLSRISETLSLKICLLISQHHKVSNNFAIRNTPLGYCRYYCTKFKKTIYLYNSYMY